MRKVHFLGTAALLILAFASTCFISGCKKDDDKNGPDAQTKDPLWMYYTGENPYGSRPWVAGGQLVVCSRQDNQSDLGSVHCINAASGAFSWKMTDSTVTRTSPVVYNEYVVYGGYNVHALNLADGHHEWDYRDDLVHLGLYSSPLLDGEHVYIGWQMSLLNLDATNGAIVWENVDESCMNSALPAPFMENGKVYYATLLGRAYQYDAISGNIDWFLEFNSGFDNVPLVCLDKIYVGMQETDPTKNSLFCYLLDGSTLVWSKKIGQVLSNMTYDGDKLYVVGNQTLYCLSTADGSEHWNYVMSAGTIAQPSISGGRLYIGNGDNLLCLDAATGEGIWSYTAVGEYGFSSPTISGDKLYVSCADGNIYCFSL
jgi:outer membrane protein assembly factor BamB